MSEPCPKCSQPADRLYVMPSGIRCFGCTPEADKIDRQGNVRYPKWEAAEALAHKRAQIARQNFNRPKQEAQCKKLS